MAKSRNWCFTINNYGDDDVANIAAWPARFTIYGKEKGEQGTPHLQGYTVFELPQRLAALKKLHATAHWEQAKGNSEQNIAYCSKQGDVTEHGTRPKTSKDKGDAEKRRWADAFDKAKTGDIDSIDGDIKLRFYRTLKEIKKDHMLKATDADDVTGVWIYGKAGVGKSRKAREDYPNAYLKMQNKWWDGYQGEEYVILDDFDSKELGHHLKIWADRYSFIAETKGGAIQIRPKKFIITSNYGPDEFGWDEDTTAAIKRRFKIVHMLSPVPGQMYL